MEMDQSEWVTTLLDRTNEAVKRAYWQGFKTCLAAVLLGLALAAGILWQGEREVRSSKQSSSSPSYSTPMPPSASARRV